VGCRPASQLLTTPRVRAELQKFAQGNAICCHGMQNIMGSAVTVCEVIARFGREKVGFVVQRSVPVTIYELDFTSRRYRDLSCSNGTHSLQATDQLSNSYCHRGGMATTSLRKQHSHRSDRCFGPGRSSTVLYSTSELYNCVYLGTLRCPFSLSIRTRRRNRQSLVQHGRFMNRILIDMNSLPRTIINIGHASNHGQQAS